jgi:aspartate-semialdehyde dehydrogenase
MRGLRVGVVHPNSPFGQRVRELLDEGHIPVIELKLLETELPGEATLTQFGDEILVTQPLDPDLFPHLDVLFVAAEDSDLVNRLARQAAEEGVLTIVHGAVGLDAPIAFAENPDLEARLVAVPRMGAYLLGRTLLPLTETFDVRGALATLLLPAQDLGNRGAHELHQQVVNLLNFKEPPIEVFAEQIAFNARVHGSTTSFGNLAKAFESEAESIAGIGGRVSLNLLQVPVFHGYSSSIFVELGAPADERAVAACFKRPTFELSTGRSSAFPTPLSAAESESIHIGAIRPAKRGDVDGCWLWAVADTTAYDPGHAAISIARAALA